MPSVKQRLKEIEVELFEFYQGFRGVPAPRNSYTEGMWREWERLTALSSASIPSSIGRVRE